MRLWEMTQAYKVQRGDRQEAFTVIHRLRIRPAGMYAAAFEPAGFRIQELISGYPGASAVGERRMIFLARRD